MVEALASQFIVGTSAPFFGREDRYFKTRRTLTSVAIRSIVVWETLRATITFYGHDAWKEIMYNAPILLSQSPDAYPNGLHGKQKSQRLIPELSLLLLLPLAGCAAHKPIASNQLIASNQKIVYVAPNELPRAQKEVRLIHLLAQSVEDMNVNAQNPHIDVQREKEIQKLLRQLEMKWEDCWFTQTQSRTSLCLL
jgi:hypothetical protein